MSTILKQLTAPTEEPLTLADAKNQLPGVDFDDDDDRINGLISVARAFIENLTNRQLVQATWDYYLDAFPPASLSEPSGNTRYIEIPKGQLGSITFLKYTDSGGVTTTWTQSGTDLIDGNGLVWAHVDSVSDPGRLVLPFGRYWPISILKTSLPIQIRFTAGWADHNAVPADLKHAMKYLIAHYYRNLEAVVIGRGITTNEVALTATALVANYRIRPFGDGGDGDGYR